MSTTWDNVRPLSEDERGAAEASVVRWLWSVDRDLHDPRPLLLERQGVTPKRMSDKPPKRRVPRSSYGVDRANAVVVARDHNAAGTVVREHFRIAPERADEIEWQRFEFQPDGVRVLAQSLRVQVGPGGSPLESSLVGVLGNSQVERYAHDAQGRVVSIAAEWRDDAALAAPSATEQYTIAYDSDGRVAFISELKLGFVYGRPDRDKAAQGAKELQGRLCDAIVAAASRLGDTNPVAAVVISYDDLLPPFVGLLTVRERDAAHNSSELASGPDSLWNPAHMSHRLSVPDDYGAEHAADLARLCTAQQLQWAHFDSLDVEVQRLAERLAGDLNRTELPRGAVTDDFVAIAVDSTLDRLGEQAEATGPPDRIRQLRVQGLLP